MWSSLALVLMVEGAGRPAAAQAGPRLIELEELAQGLEMPVGLAHAGDGSGRLFVVEQSGRVWTFDGVLSEEPYLDLSDRISCCGELGLFGIAFHPSFAENGRLFASYTEPGGDSMLTEFLVSGDPTDPSSLPDPGSEREVLRVAQPSRNHNGGHLAFGADGMLYLALGDGGDVEGRERAQRMDELPGKILRLDVDSAVPYAIPPDNPFVGGGGRGEIWVLGLRNPWRFSVDRKTGDLYIGDVGEERFEEIDVQPRGSGGGQNFGWGIKEARECFEPPEDCDETGLTDPVLVYGHDLGCSVTGGYRHRGPHEPTLSRLYVYADFCSGRIWGAVSSSQGVFRSRLLLDSTLNPTAFGEDEAGRLYVVNYRGRLYRVRGRPLFASGFEQPELVDWTAVRGPVTTSSPGLAGSRVALELALDDRGRRAFLRSNHPRREETFEACFDIDPGRSELGDARVELLRLRGGGAHLRLGLEAGPRGYRAVLEVRETERGFRAVGRAHVLPDRTTELCVDWFRATSDEAADGEARLSKNGRTSGVATGLANRRFTVASVLLGLPGGSSGTAGGTLRIDNFTSSP